MNSSTARIRRIAVQHAETARLLGVDFLPVRLQTAVPPVTATAPSRTTPRSAGATSGGSKAELLAKLREEHDRECPHCTKATGHTQTVFGDGSPDAALMFIGEAPGAEEDRQGIPFVGASGKKLTEMILAMGFQRSEIYIANILKSRPPNNDTPTPEEAANCGPYLARQIEIIAPKVIVTLGKPAVNYLLQSRDAMSNLRGRWHDYRGIPVMPTFHPAFLLRQYTPENRQKVWSDLKQALTKLAEFGIVPGNSR